MIIGLGNDLVDIRRIEKSLKEFGAKFEERVFTPREREKAKSRSGAGKKSVAATYAKRFAAKEAAAKALKLGIRKNIRWHDIEVVNGKLGAPELRLTGAALKHLKAMTPKGRMAEIHLALTDEYPYALATVVISLKAT